MASSYDPSCVPCKNGVPGSPDAHGSLDGKTRVLTFGVFDYFHYGHLRLFKQAKEHGDYLIVAVQNEDFIKQCKPEATIFYSTEQRLEIVSSLRIVDMAITYNTAEDGKEIDFDVLALGEDQVSCHFSAIEKWADTHGKKVVRLKRTPNVCSSQIKSNITSLQ